MRGGSILSNLQLPKSHASLQRLRSGRCARSRTATCPRTGVHVEQFHQRTLRSCTAYAATTSDVASSDPMSIDAAAPPVLSGTQIRSKFLEFYASRGHKVLPSASLVPEDPTVLLTIAGMLPFKPIFLGQRPREVPRATTTQKCIRTNDIENVGVTARHHTFFEMLGNFSFGDYFKEDACRWAWQLSTEVFQLPPERIYVSVYEEDDEAFALWKDVIGVPEERIKRMGAKDNFWSSGPTGPCGPCSELYYDLHPGRGAADIDLDDGTRFIEFYNLVFMELNRGADGSTAPLAAKNIDTGLGLERMAQILQAVPNNYETDLIKPIMDKAAEIAGLEYAAADEVTKTSLKVIADHIRAVVYLVSDGVIPSNVGRGYVARRLLRRVVLKGRLLGITQPFVSAVASVAVELSPGCDPQVAESRERVIAEITREEERFLGTIAAGQSMLDRVLERAEGAGGVVAGADVFMLYDTYGFPLELTQEVAEGRNLTVDGPGFEAAMKEQRARSKDAREDVDLTADSALAELASETGTTQFTGYAELLGAGSVVRLVRDGDVVETCCEGDSVDVVLDTTPFYAESGGQVGDTGVLTVAVQSSGGAALQVQDVQKAAGGQLFVHKCRVTAGEVAAGETVSAAVDAKLRRRTRANHTATHLLQAALKAVLGDDVAQQGSLVRSDALRFDFNLPRPMTPAEISSVEEIINTWIEEAHPLQTSVMGLTEAKAAGAVAMFGEKYDNEVRVVDVPGVSMELCGGTHVANTVELGGFKVLSESGIASGIRRIEAVAGPALMPHVNSVDAVVRDLSVRLKIGADSIPARVESMQKELMAKEKQIVALQSEVAVAKASALAAQAVDVNGVKVLVTNMGEVDAGSLQKAASSLGESLGDPSMVLLGSTPPGGKVSLVAAFSESLVKERKMNAGKFVGGLAKLCGGGGGGKPALAQAGGKNVEKLPEALRAGEEQLREMLA